MSREWMIDTHAHYDDEAFDGDREVLIESLNKNRILRVVNIGASIETSQNSIALAKKYPHIYAAVGVHPSETEELDEEKFEQLSHLADEEKVVAIGEIGLDYYWPEPSKEIQKKWFERQMELAREKKLPIVIHSRDAAKDTLDMMVAKRAGEIGGVVHCYSYGVELAREYLKMGFFFGIGGVSTFKNAKKLKEVIAYLPMESIVLETDAPYLSPVPNRGKRNSSLNIPYIVEEIARIRGIQAEEVVQRTFENAHRLYPKLG